MKTPLFALSLALSLFVGGPIGCQTPQQFESPGANWSTMMGQMHFASAQGKSVVGEMVARRSPDGAGFQLQFSSGPGFPLLKLYQSGDAVRAEGLFARGRWQGRLSGAPASLRDWVQLRTLFGQLSHGQTRLQGPGWSAQAEYAGGKPVSLIATFTDGDRFAIHFAH